MKPHAVATRVFFSSSASIYTPLAFSCFVMCCHQVLFPSNTLRKKVTLNTNGTCWICQLLPTCKQKRSSHPPPAPPTNLMDSLSVVPEFRSAAERMSSGGGGTGDNLGRPPAHADITQLSPNCVITKAGKTRARQFIVVSSGNSSALAEAYFVLVPITNMNLLILITDI